MTEHEHAEVSRQLALAIGWESDQMAVCNDKVFVANWPRKDNRKSLLQDRRSYPLHLLPWSKFDYRDAGVIWPIAERFNCFPSVWREDEWVCVGPDALYYSEKTAALAVARAVIAAKEKA